MDRGGILGPQPKHQLAHRAIRRVSRGPSHADSFSPKDRPVLVQALGGLCSGPCKRGSIFCTVACAALGSKIERARHSLCSPWTDSRPPPPGPLGGPRVL